MRYYEADIDRLIKMVFKGEEVTRQLLFDKVMEMDEIAKDPERMFQIFTHLNAGVQKYNVGQAFNIWHNAQSQMLWEASALYRAVEIYVNDVDLIECMLRTDIEAIMGDVRLPFPICEFVFPEGIPLGYLDYELSGCLIADSKNFNIYSDWRKQFEQRAIIKPDGMAGEADTIFFSRLIRKGVRDGDGVSWLRFNHTSTLDGLPTDAPVPAEDSQANKILVRLVFGLCLYMQTEEGRKALTPLQPCRRNNKFIGPSTVKVLGARSKYKLRDMITHGLREPGDDLGGSHAGPRAHWRKLHMRSLRHEKYKRNENGSIRVIWVRPALINAAQDEQLIGASRRL